MARKHSISFAAVAALLCAAFVFHDRFRADPELGIPPEASQEVAIPIVEPYLDVDPPSFETMLDATFGGFVRTHDEGVSNRDSFHGRSYSAADVIEAVRNSRSRRAGAGAAAASSDD